MCDPLPAKLPFSRSILKIVGLFGGCTGTGEVLGVVCLG